MNSTSRVDSKSTMFSIAMLMLTGMGTIQMQPVLGGALVDHMGLTLQQIGVLFGIELISMAVACAGAAFWADRYDRRRILQLAVMATFVASIASMLAGNFVALCAARLAAGVAGGVIQAIVYATAAMRTRKDRTYALLNIAVLLWGALSLGVLPPVIANFGTGAVFTCFVALSAVCLMLTQRVPSKSLASPQGKSVPSQRIGANGGLLLVLFILLFAGHGSLWIYQERIGKAIGISPQHIGMILGLSVLSGAVGAGLAGAIGKRLSHRTAQLIAFAGAIAATLTMVYGGDGFSYALTACLIMLVWFFGLTYLLTLAAEMDASGRLPGLANAAIFVGQGLGPAVGAIAVGAGNFRAVGWVAAAIYAVALVVSLLVTSRQTRRGGQVEGPSQLRSA